MVDRSSAGVTGTPFTVLVEAGKIREYARATYSHHEDYFGDRPVSPPHFLVTRAHWESEASDVFTRMHMDPSRGLHAAQVFEFAGAPPAAGTRLTAQSRIDRIYDKHSSRSGLMTFVDVITEFRDQRGDVAARMSTLSVEVEKVAAPQQPAASAANAPEETFLEAGPAPLSIGPITRTDLVRFAGASGDFNPVHHDEPYARAAGYDSTLAMGMFQAGIGATWATGWLGPRNVRRAEVRFMGRMFPGDRVIAHGGITRRFERAGEPLVEVTVTCRNQRGEAAIRGVLEFAELFAEMRRN
jgi:acyl dehydratase